MKKPFTKNTSTPEYRGLPIRYKYRVIEHIVGPRCYSVERRMLFFFWYRYKQCFYLFEDADDFIRHRLMKSKKVVKERIINY